MRRSMSLAAILALGLLPVLVTPAAAFPLSTCSLALESTDASGTGLDTASSGAADATVSTPFKVDWEGQVSYVGSTNVVIKDYTYQVSVFGVPTPLRGSDANDDETTDGDGSVSVSANSPFRVAGLYYVSGGYRGAGGECVGSGWFQLLGSPIGTVPWLAGIVLTVLGALGLVAGSRAHLITSIAGGVSLGLGLDLLLISHSFMPFAENTPLVMLIAAIAVGTIIGILGLRARGGPQPAGA